MKLPTYEKGQASVSRLPSGLTPAEHAAQVRARREESQRQKRVDAEARAAQAVLDHLPAHDPYRSFYKQQLNTAISQGAEMPRTSVTIPTSISDFNGMTGRLTVLLDKVGKLDGKHEAKVSEFTLAMNQQLAELPANVRGLVKQDLLSTLNAKVKEHRKEIEPELKELMAEIADIKAASDKANMLLGDTRAQASMFAIGSEQRQRVEQSAALMGPAETRTLMLQASILVNSGDPKNVELGKTIASVAIKRCSSFSESLRPFDHNGFAQEIFGKESQPIRDAARNINLNVERAQALQRKINGIGEPLHAKIARGREFPGEAISPGVRAAVEKARIESINDDGSIA